MTDPDDLGETLFNAYVRQRPDLRAQRHELSGTRRPDFTLSSPSGEVICEVYSPSLLLDGGGSFDSFGPVGRAFKSRKRKQGAAAKATNIPYVVVVTDTNSDVPFGEFDLMVAMFGRERPVHPGQNTRYSALAVVSSFNPTQARLDKAVEARTPNDASLSVSLRVAVETQEELERSGAFDATARVCRVRVIHNPWAAVKLPIEVFSGPHDEQFDFDTASDSGGLVVVFQGPRIAEVDH